MATVLRILAFLLLWSALSVPGRAALTLVPAGQSPLPVPTGTTRKTAAEIIAAVTKDKEAALAQLAGKPLRITGKVAGFNADAPLNHEDDLLVDLTPEGTAAEASPWKVWIRITRPQFKAFRVPQDRLAPVTDARYKTYVRVLNPVHAIAYFNKDLNCIALYDSEDLTVPPTTPPPKVKPPTVPFVADKIPLVSVGDAFDADAVFEAAPGDNILVFAATVGLEKEVTPPDLNEPDPKK